MTVMTIYIQKIYNWVKILQGINYIQMMPYTNASLQWTVCGILQSYIRNYENEVEISLKVLDED